MAKTLIFNFDGTGNEPGDAGEFAEDESISNVLKLHVLMGGGLEPGGPDVETPNGETQCAFYYNGIGTREGNLRLPLLGRLYSAGHSAVNMVFAPRWGDAGRILREAKEDFGKVYEAGDRLVVTGFSRGAALARKFVATILREDARREVAFLGVFDTVAAMDGIHRQGEKISTDVVFESGSLHANVKRAVHIVSLDEDRVTFTPTLINRDEGDEERILEVWFPGVHSDIGGGYWHDGLSDLALEFMIGQCRAALGNDILIGDGGDSETIRALLEKRGLAGNPDNGLPEMDIDDFLIHPLATGVMHEHGGLIAKAGEQTPRSVCVNRNDRPDRNACPLVHHSVSDRFKSVAGYRPAALRGLKFQLLRPSGNTGAPIHGIGGLRAIP